MWQGSRRRPLPHLWDGPSLCRRLLGEQCMSEVLHFLTMARWLNAWNRYYGVDAGSPRCFDTASWGVHRACASSCPERTGPSGEPVRPGARSHGAHGPPPSVPQICSERLLYVRRWAGCWGSAVRRTDGPSAPPPSTGETDFQHIIPQISK